MGMIELYRCKPIQNTWVLPRMRLPASVYAAAVAVAAVAFVASVCWVKRQEREVRVCKSCNGVTGSSGLKRPFGCRMVCCWMLPTKLLPVFLLLLFAVGSRESQQ